MIILGLPQDSLTGVHKYRIAGISLNFSDQKKAVKLRQVRRFWFAIQKVAFVAELERWWLFLCFVFFFPSSIW